jgi:hypothetical protein
MPFFAVGKREAGDWMGVAKPRSFPIKFAVLLKSFVILLFASFSSFARRKRRRGWATAQIGIKSVFVHSLTRFSC